MQGVRGLLLYKIDPYDDHLTKFRADEMSVDRVEKLWERKK